MTTQQNIPATGSHTTNGTPHGYSSLAPFLVVADPAAALDFYREVFSARVINAFRFGDTVVHAELQFADGRLQLGAILREKAANFVSGDRFASVRDPFGVRWSIMTRVEDLSDEESQQRVEEWSAGQG